MKKPKPTLSASPFFALGLCLTLFHLSCAQPPAALNPNKSGDSQPAVGEVDPPYVGDPSPTPVNPTVPKPATQPVTQTPTPVPGQTPVPMPVPVPTPKPEDTVQDPGTDGDGDFDLDANYVDAKEVKKNKDVPEGSWTKFSMKSTDSKIYKGQDSYLKEKGEFSRDGWLYLPAGYVAGTEVPFMFVGDGSWEQHQSYLRWSVDALIHDKKIPAMALVLLNPGPLGGGDGPGSQRSFEYDSVTDKFVTFVETEVLPKLTKDFNVKFTSNPEGRATMGGSSSGSMAFTMAWFKPDLYRRVLTYSGTFVNRITSTEHPQGAWEYHSKMIGAAAKKPLRVTLHASQNDNNFGSDNNWIQANRNMARVLKEKGYHYRFQYAPDAGHIDKKVYRETLPENLIWLWRGYPIKK